MTLRVEKAQLPENIKPDNSTKTEKTEKTEKQSVNERKSQERKEQNYQQTFSYSPDENDKNMGLKVEKKVMRCAGHASKTASKTGIVGGKAHAAIVDVVAAPLMEAADIITGANSDSGKNGKRLTGQHLRNYKGPGIFKPAVVVCEIIAAPFHMISDLWTGNND